MKIKVSFDIQLNSKDPKNILPQETITKNIDRLIHENFDEGYNENRTAVSSNIEVKYETDN